MGRISYVNGRYLPHSEAWIHIEDRGYQFADAVYEVCAFRDGHILDSQGHVARLKRSLNELSILPPLSEKAMRFVMRELARKNHMIDGMIYIQISRGVAPRDHLFPEATNASIVMTAKAIDYGSVDRKAERGISVRTYPDLRWARCDIKTVGLLPNLLAKQAAKEAGAADAWLVDEEGLITEAAAANAWIVTQDGGLVTRPLGPNILGGITRETVLRLAASMGIPVDERPFAVLEACTAREAFCTSASQFVMPVTRIDGITIGNGDPGSISMRLRAAYLAAAKA